MAAGAVGPGHQQTVVANPVVQGGVRGKSPAAAAGARLEWIGFEVDPGEEVSGTLVETRTQ